MSVPLTYTVNGGGAALTLPAASRDERREDDAGRGGSAGRHPRSLRNCSIRSVPHCEMLRPSISSLLLRRRIFS